MCRHEEKNVPVATGLLNARREALPNASAAPSSYLQKKGAMWNRSLKIVYASIAWPFCKRNTPFLKKYMYINRLDATLFSADYLCTNKQNDTR